MVDRERYLRHMFPDELLARGGQIELRLVEERAETKKPRGKYRFPSVERALAFLQPPNTHVYVAPVSRADSLEAPATRKGAGDIETVRHTCGLWADVDHKDGVGSVEPLTDAVRRCNALDLPPCWFIQSGKDVERGHLYWLLDRPLDVSADPERVRRVLQGLKDIVGGDAMVARPDGMMRLPGTLNVKPHYGPPFPTCRFIPPSNEAQRYAFEDIERVALANAPHVERNPRVQRTRPSPSAHPDTEAQGAPPPPTEAAASQAARLEACTFVRHAITNAATLPEPLWHSLLLILAGLGEAGGHLAHLWSRPHPAYSEVEVDTRIGYAREKGYVPPRCTLLDERGFPCPNLDRATGACRVLAVRSPADLVAKSRGPAAVGYVQDSVTWMHTDRGPRRISEFAVEFIREVHEEGRRFTEGILRVPHKRDRSIRWDAEVFTDGRTLSRQLAMDLGLDFACDRKLLIVALDVWRASSRPEVQERAADFGISLSGTGFCDPVEPIPAAAPRFQPPAGSLAAPLGLGVGAPREPERLAAEITAAWRRLVAAPEFVGAMLGLVSWALVAPAVEARHPAEVRSLLAWLGGRTGIGKTTHARIAQCFFGNFSTAGALANFGGTALSLEDAGHWYRGALMVIDDAKHVVLGTDALRAFEGFVQRASDRSARTRLRQDGTQVPAKPFRATALFTGEDLVLTSAAGAARLLIVQVPDPVGSDDDLAAVGALLPGLSRVTRGFIEWLIADAGWMPRAWDAWRSARSRALDGLSPDTNRSRIAGSVASVVAGYVLWNGWLDVIGVHAPCSIESLHGWLGGSASRQMIVMEDLSPGAWFLENLRTALATGRAALDGNGGAERCVGCIDEELGVAYIQPETALAIIRLLLARDAPAHGSTAIVEDLDRMGALVQRDPQRRTKRKRLRKGEAPAITWAISAALLMPSDDGEDGASEG